MRIRRTKFGNSIFIFIVTVLIISFKNKSLVFIIKQIKPLKRSETLPLIESLTPKDRFSYPSYTGPWQIWIELCQFLRISVHSFSFTYYVYTDRAETLITLPDGRIYIFKVVIISNLGQRQKPA